MLLASKGSLNWTDAMVLDSSCEGPGPEAADGGRANRGLLDLETQPLLPMHHLTVPSFHYGAFGDQGERERRGKREKYF